jgi:hypothetical protein
MTTKSPFCSRAIGGVVALVATACIAVGQQAISPDLTRQSINDAWWTGPMLAPSAATLPKGHFLVEPYLYDVTTQGTYDSKGVRRSSPHANSFGSLTYALYGLSDKFTIGMIPVFGYNELSGEPNSAGIRMGDWTAQAQYRLTAFREGRSIPGISVAVQQTFPTGSYDHLGERQSNALGSGAYTTTLAMFSQTYFWLPNGRILRMRLNVLPTFSSKVNVRDASVYGTTDGFRGVANPGASIFVDGAWEYSLTRRWVLALDATYRHQANTPVNGYNSANPATAIAFNSGTSSAFGLAPAVEYSWKANLGVLLGVRLIPLGRNTSATITPAIAINYVH